MISKGVPSSGCDHWRLRLLLSSGAQGSGNSFRFNGLWRSVGWDRRRCHWRSTPCCNSKVCQSRRWSTYGTCFVVTRAYLPTPTYLCLPTYINIPTYQHIPTYDNLPTFTNLCQPTYPYQPTSTYLPTNTSPCQPTIIYLPTCIYQSLNINL